LLRESGKPVTVVSPFGLDGPMSNRAATAGTLFAMGGEASMLPGGLGYELFPEAPPLLVRGLVAEFDAGVISALVASASMYQALGGSDVQQVDVSKLEVQTSLNRWLVSHYRMSGWIESRATRSYSFGGLVACSDGYVMLQPTTDGHWRSLVSMLGSPMQLADEAFDTQAGRHERASEIQEQIVRWASSRTRAEVFAEGLELGIPVAPFRSAAEVADCEQYASRGYFVPYERDGEAGAQVPGLPFPTQREPGDRNAAAPWRGRDTLAVLRTLLDLSDAEIEDLLKQGVITQRDVPCTNLDEHSWTGATVS
jgi:crotonobetainyl-CoA:carnitine CoA-transferase CaiB-like acyl-CoA transferase